MLKTKAPVQSSNNVSQRATSHTMANESVPVASHLFTAEFLTNMCIRWAGNDGSHDDANNALGNEGSVRVSTPCSREWLTNNPELVRYRG